MIHIKHLQRNKCQTGEREYVETNGYVMYSST